MMVQFTERENQVILAVVLTTYFLWLAVPIAFNGAESIRIVAVFDDDEALLFGWIKQAIKQKTLFIPFWNYGHLYFNLGIFPLFVIDQFAPVTDQVIIVFYRLLSACFFAGSVWVIYLIQKQLTGKNVALAMTLISMLSSLMVIDYSIMIHPDTAQLFFILLGFLLLMHYEKNKKFHFLLLSSTAAGLAFSTKYAGIFLLPLLAFAFLRNNTDKPIKGKVLKLAGVVLSFFIAFAIASPALIYDFNFIEGLYSVKNSIEDGHVMKNDQSALEWLYLLADNRVLGIPLLLLSLTGISFVALKRPNINYIYLLIWLTMYMALLLVQVKARFEHYLMPVLPFLVIFIGELLQSDYLKSRIKFLVYAVLLYSLGKGVVSVQNYRKKDFLLMKEHPAMLAGKWLNEHYPTDQIILYDKYIYVPEVFTQVVSSWGITHDLVNELDPAIIMINKKTYSRYHKKEDATLLIGKNPEFFLERHHFYSEMLQGNSGYALVKELGEIKVYQKNP